MTWYWILIFAVAHLVLWILCSLWCYHDMDEGCGDMDYSLFAGCFWPIMFPILIVRRMMKLILKKE